MIEQFVERFAQVLVDSACPHRLRIAIAIMATDEGRLTAAELAERLHASPAAVSGGVRYLTQVGIVHRGRERGSRRDHFTVEHDWLYQTIAQRDSILVRWSAGLREGVQAVGGDTPAGRRLPSPWSSSSSSAARWRASSTAGRPTAAPRPRVPDHAQRRGQLSDV
ncbi:GbsR/MarR family transcriptional regulator [Luedemannella flava]